MVENSLPLFVRTFRALDTLLSLHRCYRLALRSLRPRSRIRLQKVLDAFIAVNKDLHAAVLMGEVGLAFLR